MVKLIFNIKIKINQELLLNITAGDCQLTRISVEFWAELKNVMKICPVTLVR